MYVCTVRIKLGLCSLYYAESVVILFTALFKRQKDQSELGALNVMKRYPSRVERIVHNANERKTKVEYSNFLRRICRVQSKPVLQEGYPGYRTQ